MSEIGTGVMVETAGEVVDDPNWYHDWGEIFGPGGGASWWWDTPDDGVSFAGDGGTFVLKAFNNGYVEEYNNDLAAWKYVQSMQPPAVVTFRMRFRNGPIARPSGDPYNYTEFYLDIADSDVRTGLSNLNQYWQLYLYTGPGGVGDPDENHLYGIVTWWGGVDYLSDKHFNDLTPIFENVWGQWIDVRAEASRDRCDIYLTLGGTTQHMFIEVAPMGDYHELNRIHAVVLNSNGYATNTVGTGYIDIEAFTMAFTEAGSMERFGTPVGDGWGTLVFATDDATVVDGIASVTDRQYGLDDTGITGWLGVGRLEAQASVGLLVVGSAGNASSFVSEDIWDWTFDLPAGMEVGQLLVVGLAWFQRTSGSVTPAQLSDQIIDQMESNGFTTLGGSTPQEFFLGEDGDFGSRWFYRVIDGSEFWFQDPDFTISSIQPGFVQMGMGSFTELLENQASPAAIGIDFVESGDPPSLAAAGYPGSTPVRYYAASVAGDVTTPSGYTALTNSQVWGYEQGSADLVVYGKTGTNSTENPGEIDPDGWVAWTLRVRGT